MPTGPYENSSLTGPVLSASTFGRYVLLGECKAGGMGVVYKARDTALDRVVALKKIKADGLAWREQVIRFQREARAVARLKHPHIVAIHDVAQEQGLHYLTMEYRVRRQPGGAPGSLRAGPASRRRLGRKGRPGSPPRS
jgi:hypothetical protein